MSLRRPLYVSIVGLFLVWNCAGQSKTVEQAARRFLPPNARLAELVTIDPQTFKPIKGESAVLRGHILSPASNDIVFAYHTPASVPNHDKSLFVTLLHETPSGFVKLHELTYYGRILMRDVSTPGLQLLRLSKDGRDAVLLYTGIGALLGGEVQVFQWDSDWGLVNIMPSNASVRRVSLKKAEEGLRVTLSFEKYPGQEGVPPPETYRWNGEKFVRQAD